MPLINSNDIIMTTIENIITTAINISMTKKEQTLSPLLLLLAKPEMFLYNLKHSKKELIG